MSEQINEQVETSTFEEVEIPEVEATVEVQQPVQPTVVVMPKAATIQQRMLDTGLTMVCGVVVTRAMDVVVGATTKAIGAGFGKVKELAAARKERKLQKKVEKEAAKLEAAAQAKPEETVEQ